MRTAPAAVLVAALALAAGCFAPPPPAEPLAMEPPAPGPGLPEPRPAPTGPEGFPPTLLVRSDAFGQGERIPVVHTCDGANTSPPLTFEAVPPEALYLALIMEDPDATRGTFLHWVFWDLPASTRALPPAAAMVAFSAAEGPNGAGRPGYTGPCPPSGDHRYFFTAYATVDPLGLPAGAGVEDVRAALEGRVLAWGQLMGMYARA